MKRERAVFSSIQSFAQTLMQNPGLFSIPALTPLQGLIDRIKNDNKGCGCNKNAIYLQYKGVFESALGGLTASDKESIKNMLNVEKICYYVRNGSNGLELMCF